MLAQLKQQCGAQFTSKVGRVSIDSSIDNWNVKFNPAAVALLHHLILATPADGGHGARPAVGVRSALGLQTQTSNELP